MNEELSIRELDRWQAMKIMRAQGFSIAAMVPRLLVDGLMTCQDHDPKRRRRMPDGELLCTVCENTALQFWNRNIVKLPEDEVNLVDAKWQWLEAHTYIARICRERALREVTFTTTRTELNAEGKPVSITTVRSELHLDKGALRLLAQTQDKLARFAGYDVEVVGSKGRELPRPMVVNELNARGERKPEQKPN